MSSDVFISINADTTSFQLEMIYANERINYLDLKHALHRAFRAAGVDKEVWQPWSHYLWAEDWNSQRPKPKLTMSIWDPVDKMWRKT